MTRKSTIIMLCFSFILLQSGCSELLDCLTSGSASLPDKNLETAYLSFPYTQTIYAEIINSSKDASYDYNFNIEGNLPPGISFAQSKNTIILQGTPQLKGKFKFTVRLTVVPPYDNESDTCTGKLDDKHDYSITVE